MLPHELEGGHCQHLVYYVSVCTCLFINNQDCNGAHIFLYMFLNLFLVAMVTVCCCCGNDVLCTGNVGVRSTILLVSFNHVVFGGLTKLLCI